MSVSEGGTSNTIEDIDLRLRQASVEIADDVGDGQLLVIARKQDSNGLVGKLGHRDNSSR